MGDYSATGWRRWFSRVHDDVVSMTGNDLWHILDPFDTAERERDEARAEAVRLREALNLIAERWPDSETGHIARAALEPPSG